MPHVHLTRTVTILEHLSIEVPEGTNLKHVADNYTDYLDGTENWETGDYLNQTEFIIDCAADYLPATTTKPNLGET